eukprot:1955997-Pyramimonas_sp.AAC.1
MGWLAAAPMQTAARSRAPMSSKSSRPMATEPLRCQPGWREGEVRPMRLALGPAGPSAALGVGESP